MRKHYTIPSLPLGYDLETKAILRQVNKANRWLAELKGVAATIPNEAILISTLTLQEAKDSSEIENIVTTQDELYRAELDTPKGYISAATKEVLRYREALQHGFDLVKRDKLLTNTKIKDVQAYLEGNRAGFRTQAGTMLKDSAGHTVYTPPQNAQEIEAHMANLEAFINKSELCDVDPLIKMAIIHHQFESIHPFYDGNGRAGRIINILYLVINGLLDLPILYLSRYVTQHKQQYYQLIQSVRDAEGDNAKAWEKWIMFILEGIERTARETIHLVKGIALLMDNYKRRLRPLFGKQYKHELLNNLFFHPYTKIEFLVTELMVTRQTAAKYLQQMVDEGLLTVVKIGRENYYINDALMDLLLTHATTPDTTVSIESITE